MWKNGKMNYDPQKTTNFLALVHEVVFNVRQFKIGIILQFEEMLYNVNLNLAGYNKRLLFGAVGAPGSDTKTIRRMHIYFEILNCDRKLNLEGGGEKSLITVSD